MLLWTNLVDRINLHNSILKVRLETWQKITINVLAGFWNSIRWIIFKKCLTSFEPINKKEKKNRTRNGIKYLGWRHVLSTCSSQLGGSQSFEKWANSELTYLGCQGWGSRAWSDPCFPGLFCPSRPRASSRKIYEWFVHNFQDNISPKSCSLLPCPSDSGSSKLDRVHSILQIFLSAEASIR